MKMVAAMKTWMLKVMGLPSCEEITQFAYAYLERELDNHLERKFEQHLRKCTNCRRFVDSYTWLSRIVCNQEAN